MEPVQNVLGDRNVTLTVGVEVKGWVSKGVTFRDWRESELVSQ